MSSSQITQPQNTGRPGEVGSTAGFMYQAIQQWMDENADWEGGGPDDVDYVPPSGSTESSEADEEEDGDEDEDGGGDGDEDGDGNENESDGGDDEDMQGVDSAALTGKL